MNENNAKLDLLRREIEQYSEKETKTIIEAAQKSAEDALCALENELERENEANLRRITESCRTEQKKRVSEICFLEGKRVLFHRSALVEDFFLKVEERLTAELSTPRYTAYLEKSIREAGDAVPMTENTRVLCRERDMAAVKAALSGYSCAVEAVSDIKIGGIIVSCPERGIIIDLTLDAALETERERFSSLKEMQL